MVPIILVMVHKLDLFELIYSDGGPLTASVILKILKRRPFERSKIQKILSKMVKEGLISHNKYGFLVIKKPKHQLLYDLIHYCLDNRLNYRKLIDISIAKFIQKALLKKRFVAADFKIDTREYSKYVEILSRSGLLIILSRRPLEGTVPFNQFVAKLMEYFDLKALVAKRPGDEYYVEIERDLRTFRKKIYENSEEFRLLVEKYKFQFIKNSLSLEGNPITLTETIALLRDQVLPRGLRLKDVQEVENYQKAVNSMMKDVYNKKPFTKESILNYHYLAMYHEPKLAGKIREVPVYIKGNPKFKIADVFEINDRLGELLVQYNDFIRKGKVNFRDILEFAAYFHNEFQYIHPFVDGNSRTTRLLAIHILLYFDIPVLDIPLGLHDEYMLITKKHKKRDDKKLSQVLQRIVMYNLKSVNMQIGQ